jgi:methyltransferase-like protein 6
MEKYKQILDAQKQVVNENYRNMLIRDQQRNWDLFYKHNTVNFFKDRHWVGREFPELNDLTGKTVLELGCGVGNFMFPLLSSQNSSFKAIMCDLSPRAIEFVKQHELYNPDIVNAFVCDLTSQELLDKVALNSVDCCSAIFVFSAIPIQKLEACIENVFKVLKSGGTLLFRDYGYYDQAMLRFKKDNYIEDGFYCRSDGTFSRFFQTRDITELFGDRFEIVDLQEKKIKVVNRKRALEMDRVFIQARLRKI